MKRRVHILLWRASASGNFNLIGSMDHTVTRDVAVLAVHIDCDDDNSVHCSFEQGLFTLYSTFIIKF